MNSNKITVRTITLFALIILAAFSRMIPHMPNFSPLGAIGVFAVAHFSKKWLGIFIPIMATWLSDLFINNVIYAKYTTSFVWFYEGFYWQYGSYILIAIAAIFIMKKVNVQNVLAGALASTAIFFLVSNFGVWFSSTTTYPHTFSGLMTCYAVGIPFINGTLLGDLFYCTVLFGGFALAKKQIPSLKLSQV